MFDATFKSSSPRWPRRRSVRAYTSSRLMAQTAFLVMVLCALAVIWVRLGPE